MHCQGEFWLLSMPSYCLTGCPVKQSDASCGSKVTGWVIRTCTQSTLRCKRGWNESQPCTSFARTRLLPSIYVQESCPYARSSPRDATETNGKIMEFRKRRHCGPCALEVTNFNAVASNLQRTFSKSQSLPNSIIFITELHLPVFLALCSSSNSGKSLWTWRKTSEARSARLSLDHKNYIPNCRD